MEIFKTIKYQIFLKDESFLRSCIFYTEKEWEALLIRIKADKKFLDWLCKKDSPNLVKDFLNDKKTEDVVLIYLKGLLSRKIKLEMSFL